jgi:hypothetical protein
MTRPASHLRRLPARVRAAFLTALLAGTALAAMPALAADWTWGFGKNISGSGTIKSEVRTVSGFTSISLSLPAYVEVRQGSSEGVTVETDDNLLPLVETVVENGALKIRSLEKNTNLKTKNMKITVNAKTIEALAVAGSGDIRADALKAGNLKVAISGSGDIHLKSLESEALKVSISGSGDFSAAGKSASVEASIAGSGDVKAGKLQAGEVKVSIAGSGSAEFWARDTLKSSIAGSGDVTYYGDAKVSSSKAGSGTVKRLGAAPQ